jgi:hypothetical protein
MLLFVRREFFGNPPTASAAMNAMVIMKALLLRRLRRSTAQKGGTMINGFPRILNFNTYERKGKGRG